VSLRPVRVRFHSPLPPAKSGVADYSAVLLGALSRLGEVATSADAPADIDLYHIGNNPLHLQIYRRALRTPGVVALHDAVLHHFLLNALGERDYVEEFVYNYGEWNRGLAAELWQGRARAAAARIYFERPMLRRVAESARAVIVHNARAAEIVREHAPGARVVEVPHLFAPPPPVDGAEFARVRARLGLAPGTFLFGVFGFLREPKRLAPILRVFSKVHAQAPHTRLLIEGECVSPALARVLEAIPRESGVIRVGYQPEREFWKLASAADACINLRYPAAGETSGVGIRLMGIGKLVLLHEGKETASFPETACLRISTGLAEESMLEESMAWAAASPRLAAEIGERAAAYIRAEHSLERAAAMYWDVLCGCAE
jgi:glycosyltransferase involved in cell wall biosynthesis